MQMRSFSLGAVVTAVLMTAGGVSTPAEPIVAPDVHVNDEIYRMLGEVGSPHTNVCLPPPLTQCQVVCANGECCVSGCGTGLQPSCKCDANGNPDCQCEAP